MDKIINRGFTVNNVITYPKYQKDVIGFDTETNDGKVTLIADSNGRHRVIHKTEELLSFLMYKKYESSFNFFFNLEFDTDAIIKHLTPLNILELIDYDYTVYQNKTDAYRLDIIPRKNTKLSKVDIQHKKRYRHTFDYYDIYQFYQIGTLEETCNKTFEDGYVKSMDASKQFPIDKINDDDINYCIDDAKACQKLSDNLVRLCESMVYIPKYYSSASIGKAFMRKYMPEPYKFVKSRAHKLALLAYNGGRFECIKRGYFDTAYMYDINSAYPYAISKLKDIKGVVVTNKEYMENASHSFFDVYCKIEDFKVSPLKYFMVKKNLLLYPIGEFKHVYLTKGEFELLLKYGCKLKINKAVHVINDNPTYPYVFVMDLYKKRRELKDAGNPLQLPLKLALNSIYGIMIQTIKKYEIKTDFSDIDVNDDAELITHCFTCDFPIRDSKLINCSCCNSELTYDNCYEKLRVKKYYCGGFFNPIHAAEITANIRCKLFEDSIKYEDNIIMYATDSITFDKKVSHLPLNNNLGSYDKTEKLHGIVLGSGIYSLHSDNERLPEKKRHKVGFRGFSKRDVLDMIRGNEHDNICKITRKSPCKLKESRTKLDTLNVFIDKTKTLSVSFDKKRNWAYEPTNFHQLLTSVIDSTPLKMKN